MKALVSLLLFLPSLCFADVSVPRAVQYGWATFDVSRDGGSSTAHTIGLSLPPNAVMSSVWVYVNTSFAASGPNSSLGVSCGGSQNVMAYTDVSGVSPNALWVGKASGQTFNGGAAPIPLNSASLNFSQGYGTTGTSGCNVSFDVNSASGYTPFVSGKATLLIEYFKL